MVWSYEQTRLIKRRDFSAVRLYEVFNVSVHNLDDRLSGR